jgi:hypothetical protein
LRQAQQLVDRRLRDAERRRRQPHGPQPDDGKAKQGALCHRVKRRQRDGAVVGTKTSETSMSWLPVARRPAVSQVSMIRQSDALIHVITMFGPVGPADMVSPVKTMLAGASQSQWWQLLTNAHRPLTR